MRFLAMALLTVVSSVASAQAPAQFVGDSASSITNSVYYSDSGNVNPNTTANFDYGKISSMLDSSQVIIMSDTTPGWHQIFFYAYLYRMILRREIQRRQK